MALLEGGPDRLVDFDFRTAQFRSVDQTRWPNAKEVIQKIPDVVAEFRNMREQFEEGKESALRAQDRAILMPNVAFARVYVEAFSERMQNLGTFSHSVAKLHEDLKQIVFTSASTFSVRNLISDPCGVISAISNLEKSSAELLNSMLVQWDSAVEVGKRAAFIPIVKSVKFLFGFQKDNTHALNQMQILVDRIDSLTKSTR